MMRWIFTLFLCLGVSYVFGQSNGDYQSRATGPWSDPNTWEVYNNGWIAAVDPPTSGNGTITILSPHNVTVSSPVTIDQTVVQSGATLTIGSVIVNVLNGNGVDLTVNGTLQINSGTVRNQPSATPSFHIFGTVSNSGTLEVGGGTIIFQSTAVYNHDNSSSPGSIPPSTWVSGSICRVRGNLSGAPGGLTQDFANFEWNTPGLTGGIFSLEGALTSVAGNLSILNTGTGTLALSRSTSFTLNIGGNLSASAGTRVIFNQNAPATLNVGADFTTAATRIYSSFGTGDVTINVASSVNFTGGIFDAGASTGTTTLNIAGNFTNSGTNIIKSENPDTDGMYMSFVGAANHDFVSTLVPGAGAAVHYSVVGGGNLDIAAASRLAGAGGLVVDDQSSITLRSTATQGAYRTSTLRGNVQVTGTRNVEGTLIYAGSSIQRMHTETPDVNTIINNPASVRLNGEVTFDNGVVTMQAGNLNAAGYSLTLGEVDLNDGNIQVNTNTNLTLNGTGAFGDFADNNPDGIIPLVGTAINSLTINQTGAEGAAGKTGTLTVRSLLNLQAGVFDLGAGNTTINGVFAATSGSLVAGGGNLVFNATALPAPIMPAGVSITGQVNQLTMSRDATLNITDVSENLDVKRLNLNLGSVNSAGGLRIASAGAIYRIDGFLTSAIQAVDSYNLYYTNFTSPTITTGFELPSSPTALNLFQISNTENPSGRVILDKPVVSATNVYVVSGQLQTNSHAITMGGNFRCYQDMVLVPGRSVFTFNGSANQTYRTDGVTRSLLDIVIAKTGGSFTLQSGVDIRQKFEISSPTVVALGNDRLTLMSNADTTAYIPAVAAGASFTGRAIVQRFLPNARGSRQYRYISVPTAPATSANATTVGDLQAELPISGNFLDPSTGVFNGVTIKPQNPSLFTFNETTGAYVPYPNNANRAASTFTLVAGRGYSVFGRTSGAITYDLHGRPIFGDVSVAVTRNGTGSNAGYNLIGNPYACTIDWDLVFADNSGGAVLNSIYFIDSNYAYGSSGTLTYVGGVSTPGGFDGRMAPGQGFFVVANSGGSVTFSESHKSPGEARFVREREIPNVLQIAMKHKNIVDYTAVRVTDEATEDFDGNFDAYKFSSSGLFISTLSKGAQDTLAINSVSSGLCEAGIPVYINDAAVGNYSLEFSGFESFEAGLTPVLFDKLENKVIEITSSPTYTFAVSDKNTLKDRFELRFNMPALETSFAVKGETTCVGNSTAIVSLLSSQAGVHYTALWNGSALSAAVAGNGGELQIPVSVDALPQGATEIVISAQRGTCGAATLNEKATVIVLEKPVVNSVSASSICATGTADLTVVAVGGSLYNWYEGADDVAPIAGVNGPTFTTPVLDKTKTYYVAAVNAAGCEGARIEVRAEVQNVVPAVIVVEGQVLTSNYASGNQWYLDGVAIEGATDKTLEVVTSGVYSLGVNAGGCTTTSEAREMNILGAETNDGPVRVYPNPSPDKVFVEVRYKRDVAVDLISTTGVQLQSSQLTGSDNLKTAAFDLTSLPDGMYLVRIKTGTKTFTKKILKAK